MTLSNILPFDNMTAFLKSVEWPVMPEVGRELIRTLGDEHANTHNVGQIISKDPALTANLLRMANSAMFGFSGTVDTLDRAINVVGLAQIRVRALSICMARVADLPASLDRLTFWRYCLLCAGYAQWIAGVCNLGRDEAWLTGMMLRLGEINLGRAAPAALEMVEAQPIKPTERWLRQRQLIGFDEGQVTAELAEHWDFPHTLVNGLRHAAQPLVGDTFSTLAAVLHLAACLADAGPVTPKTIDDLPLLVMTMLNITPDALSTNPPDAEALSDISMFQD